MNPEAPKYNQELEFMAKCLSIVDNKCLSFQSSIAQMDPRLFNQILKAYSENLLSLGETKAEKYLQETLISLSTKLKKQKISEGLVMSNEKKEQKESCQEVIVVSKDREEEYDQEIVSQWKEARRHFFNHTMHQKLSQSQIPLSNQTEITKIIMEAKQDLLSHRLSIDFENRDLRKYKQQIEQLTKLFNLINQQFSRRQKETPAITQIIQLKLTGLRVINIQYSLINRHPYIHYLPMKTAHLQFINKHYRYQVSAFDLFKVVHENRGLSEVTLKGVLVIQFKKFLRAISESRLSQILEQQQQQSQEWSWMKDFRPSKSLKMVIDPQDNFQISDNEDHLCALEDLAQFGGMFQQLSGISVKILLDKYTKFANSRNNLQLLQQLLKAIGKIKIKIEAQRFVSAFPEQPFTKILQMLSSLTTIVQLSFQQIKLSYSFSINSFLAMEQILITIFDNNAVTHLRLKNCYNFPIFPAIPNLKHVNLTYSSFRRQFNFISELAKSSPFLKSIKITIMNQQFRIEEELFNRLKQLSIKCCDNVSLGVLTPSPSNIKHLAVMKSNVQIVDLYPKLPHITQLVLFQINADHSLICAIPSPHLVLLIMHKNNLLAATDLEAIDKKWPKLRQLAVHNCPNLKESDWSACEFKGLIRLSIYDNMRALGGSVRQQLKGRGIAIYQQR